MVSAWKTRKTILRRAAKSSFCFSDASCPPAMAVITNGSWEREAKPAKAVTPVWDWDKANHG
jgi:hypothetical protein